jgi:hypothetical protein
MSRSLLALTLIATLCVPMSAQAAVVTFLTSGTSYSTPVDWNNSDNSIECIGAGGNGSSQGAAGGGGGGGGAYAKIVNLTIAGSITYSIASGGSQADTTFNSTSLVCDAGNNASGGTNGTGGTTAASTGTTKFAGGDGGGNSGGLAGNGGGGGGAGGTTSAGGTGVGSGGAGGSASGGAGGSQSFSYGAPGDPGGDGTVWQVSPARGAGGGGGGGYSGEEDGGGGCLTNGTDGGAGGLFGGGGGGGGPKGQFLCIEGSGNGGAQGIITVTYTPASVPASSVRSGLKVLPFGSLKITGGGIKIQ